jgi:uncharacterized protein (DUF2249 family)
MDSTFDHAAIDARSMSTAERSARVFSSFCDLERGESMEVLDNREPQPLRRDFDQELAGYFHWSDLRISRSLWRVVITRVA